MRRKRRHVAEELGSSLMMDLQCGIVERYAGGPETMEPFARALSAARDHDVAGDIRPRCLPRRLSRDQSEKQIVFLDSKSRRHEAFGRLHANHESVAPREGEPVVTKLRVSAFAGSDLEVLLRSMGIDSLVLSGIATAAWCSRPFAKPLTRTIG